MIHRSATENLVRLASQYKAVGVIGPRQSGKTTIVRTVFPNKPYSNLENPDIRLFAQEDPRGYLDQFPDGCVLDEVQRVPELFSYLQQILDDKNEPGLFILSGSNNFLMQEYISQSLAGRIGYLKLLPFTISEVKGQNNLKIDNVIFKGFYPPLFDNNFDIKVWFDNYISTYLERDIRQIKHIVNLTLFTKFIRLCAGRVGQLLNMTNLSIETGVDQKTIASWISVLEASFIIFRLSPHHASFNKRIVKMPKLYFYDVGLASALLGIQEPSHLSNHPLRGALFENLCVADYMKTDHNNLKSSRLYFWRNNTGNEIDLLIDEGNNLKAIEIKSGQTINREYFKGLDYWTKISGSKGGMIIYGGNENQLRSNGVKVQSWQNIN